MVRRCIRERRLIRLTEAISQPLGCVAARSEVSVNETSAKSRCQDRRGENHPMGGYRLFPSGVGGGGAGYGWPFFFLRETRRDNVNQKFLLGIIVVLVVGLTWTIIAERRNAADIQTVSRF